MALFLCTRWGEALCGDGISIVAHKNGSVSGDDDDNEAPWRNHMEDRCRTGGRMRERPGPSRFIGAVQRDHGGFVGIEGFALGAT